MFRVQVNLSNGRFILQNLLFRFLVFQPNSPYMDLMQLVLMDYNILEILHQALHPALSARTTMHHMYTALSWAGVASHFDSGIQISRAPKGLHVECHTSRQLDVSNCGAVETDGRTGGCWATGGMVRKHILFLLDLYMEAIIPYHICCQMIYKCCQHFVPGVVLSLQLKNSNSGSHGPSIGSRWSFLLQSLRLYTGS